MKWLTLEIIKQQLRIETSFTEEDALLESYGSAAEDVVLNYLNRPYSDIIESYGKVPAPIVQASQMLVDVSYQYRSPISVTGISQVPYTFDTLLRPYMHLVDPDEEGCQVFTLGSDVKILVDAELPDGLEMKDVDFTVTVYNADEKDKKKVFPKNECLLTEFGNYIVLVDSEDLGIGIYMVKTVFHIPDTDYPTGYRKEVIRINPHVRVNG